MGKVKFSLAVSEIRNKVGSVVYSRNRHGNYVRDYVIPTNPNTIYQQEQRDRFKDAAEAWGLLTTQQRTDWANAAKLYAKEDIFANQYSSHGFNFFVQVNTSRLLVGSSISTTPVVFSRIPLFGQMVVESFWLSGIVNISLANSTLTSSQAVVISATPALSSAVNYFANKLSVIKVVNNATTLPVNIYTEYLAKFGTPAINSKIGLSVYVVDKTTGQRSVPVYGSLIVPRTLDPATIAYFNECPTQPSDAIKLIYDDFILALKGGTNNWAKCLRIWAMWSPYEDNAIVSIVNPTSTPISAKGGIPYTAGNGYRSNNATQYLDLNLDLSTDGAGIYTNDSGGFTSYAITNTNGGMDIGIENPGTTSALLSSRSSGEIQGYVNQETFPTTVAVASSVGVTSIQRIAGFEVLIKDGLIVGLQALAPSSVPSGNIYGCGINDGSGSFVNRSLRRYVFMAVHGGDIDYTEWYIAVRSFAIAMGIP